MLTLQERIEQFNLGLNALAERYGLRPDVQIATVEVTRGGLKGVESTSQLILTPIPGWVEPPAPPSADNTDSPDAS